MSLSCHNGSVKVTFPGPGKALWRYECQGSAIDIPAPIFEVEGRRTPLAPNSLREIARSEALPGVTEFVLEGQTASEPRLTLQSFLRIPAASPVVRFRYAVRGQARLTKTAGHDCVTYLSADLGTTDEVREVRLSDFDELVHSYRLVEEEIPDRSFQDRMTLMGPILCARDSEHGWLCAYEHGSQPPYRFLEFALQSDRSVELRAVRGNYWNGFDLRNGYETIWFDVAAVLGGFDELAQTWHKFILRWMSPNPESRKPYIFYNT